MVPCKPTNLSTSLSTNSLEIIMSLESTVTALLPTASAKIALGMTIALGLAPFLVPEYAVAEIQLTGQVQLWLVKLAVCLLLVLVGSCVTLSLIICYYTRGKGQEEIADRIMKVRAAEYRQKLEVQSILQRLQK